MRKYENLRFTAGLLTDEAIQQTLTEAIGEQGEEIIYIKTEWVGGQPAIICITGVPLPSHGLERGRGLSDGSGRAVTA